MKTIVSIPNAERTFEALRSLGYDLNSSVADIIDNAITERVRTKHISVIFKRKENQFICRIKDDGSGMTTQELEEGMRIGTETSYGEHDLGKFGMGMKTASLSHCNMLTVISKTKNAETAGYRWDLGHVKGTKQWSLLQLNEKEIAEVLTKEEVKFPEHGTIVFWDDLYLLDNEYRSFTIPKLAENYYFRILGNLKLHLRMVYHRFLDGSLGNQQTIKIDLNGNSLEPWDPFCRSEVNTIELNIKNDLSQLAIPSYEKPVVIKGFVLPNKEGFSSEKAWEEARGLLSWNDSQGYYIYRANRLIRFGGWHGTKAKDEHDKLARISIDIDPSLDGLFRITVNKSKVQFPENLFNHLKNKVNRVVIREAQKQYRKSGEKSIVNNKFRKQEAKLTEVSKNLVEESHIKTQKKEADDIAVNNPSGSYLSNKIQEFLRYGTDKDFEVVSGELDNDHLWKIVCNTNEKFKVIINTNHPFYSKIYNSGTNKAFTSAIDALIFSLAFAELYNRNESNSNLFDTFKSVCSKALEKLTKGELI
ncbi:MAG TPA: ATP-binding protein [Candidatus Wunengus sp. YC63]|uniref:ATP-binding protein n=1 Tax=unclassified Candidatus Wunengus TaxID=3367695 RepID=UPI00402945E0